MVKKKKKSNLSPVLCPLRLIAVPLSKRLGVKDRIRIRAASVPKLETFYKQNSRQPSQVCIPALPPMFWTENLSSLTDHFLFLFEFKFSVWLTGVLSCSSE